MIKIKFRGMKQKIEFLGYEDVITDDCFQTPTNGYNFNPRTKEEYDAVVKMFEEDPSAMKMYRWHSTSGEVTGDRVCDEHSHRTYFRIVK